MRYSLIRFDLFSRCDQTTCRLATGKHYISRPTLSTHRSTLSTHRPSSGRHRRHTSIAPLAAYMAAHSPSLSPRPAPCKHQRTVALLAILGSKPATRVHLRGDSIDPPPYAPRSPPSTHRSTPSTPPSHHWQRSGPSYAPGRPRPPRNLRSDRHCHTPRHDRVHTVDPPVDNVDPPVDIVDPPVYNVDPPHSSGRHR